MWGLIEMNVECLTLLFNSPGWCNPERLVGKEWRGRRETKDDVRSRVAEGAVRQTESRGDAIDSDAKPFITEFLGGHRGGLCVFTGKECSVY